MHLQYDKRYNQIGQNGCYLVSLGAWAEELTGVRFTDSQFLHIYALAIVKGWMEPNCFILDPEKVMNAMLVTLGSGERVEYIGWWNKDSGPQFWDGATSEDIDFEILRVSTPWGYHFKTAGFNPYPELDQGDEINGRRYFKVV